MYVVYMYVCMYVCMYVFTSFLQQASWIQETQVYCGRELLSICNWESSGGHWKHLNSC